MNRGTDVFGEPAVPTAGEIQRQIDRISASSGLKNAGPILSIFQFLGKQALDFPGQAVKEYEIATSALGRPTDFDPRLDSTVRVVVMRLRSRLAEYYTHDGVADAVLLDIPKGAYFLSITARPMPEPVAPSAPASLPPHPAKSSRRTSLLASLLLAAVVTVSFLAGRYAAVTPPPQDLSRFWNSLLESGDPLLVYSNPIFEGSPETGMHLLDPSAFHTAGTNDSYTGTGEVMAVHELSKTLTLLRHGFRIKRARLFTWDEALANNLIIVGGPAQSSVSKQWPKLERFILKGPGEQPFPGQEAIRDDRSGTLNRYYVASRYADVGTEYAIVALTPSASADRWMLLLAGTNTFGTEAAARLVSQPQLLSKLLAGLGVNSSRYWTPPHFEALVKVEIRGGAPLEPELLEVYRRSR